MNRLRCAPVSGSRAVLIVVSLVALASIQLPAVVAVARAEMTSTSEMLAPGLEHVELHQVGGELAIHVARLAPGAPVHLKAVLAGGAVASASPGRETTSAVCGRVGGTVCVNADFATCMACREAVGGFASAGVIRRSFHPHHEQFTLTSDGFTLERMQWRAELRATYRWPAATDPPSNDLLAPPPARQEAREEVRVLVVDGLNRGEEAGTLLLTADWGAATTAVADRLELVLTLDADFPTRRHAADLHGIRDGGDRLQPGQAVVRGPAAPVQSFWDEWNGSDSPDKTLELDIVSTERILESIGGHPVLLRDGRRSELNRQDSKVSQRHPRSLVGWTADNELLLVTIDGRRPGWSRGATLDEATDLLVDLGATNAMNLDGGGSTTFVAPCGTGLCARNRPSDGGERKVPVVLALIVEQGAAEAHRRAQAQQRAAEEEQSPPATDPPAPAPPVTAPPLPAADPAPEPVAPPPVHDPEPVVTEAAPVETLPPPPEEFAVSEVNRPVSVSVEPVSTSRRAPDAGSRSSPAGGRSGSSTALTWLALSCLLAVLGATAFETVRRPPQLRRDPIT